LDEKSLNFLRQTFMGYYSSRGIWVPREMENREFGFFMGREKVMLRHRSFRSQEELSNFLVQKAPFDVYYSVATYDHPEEEMSEKGWRNADIVFDIDADHLEHECKEEHDFWICGACQKEGKGSKPTRCPACENKEVVEVTWICDKCLGLAKQEVFKLIEVLQEDFGVAEDKISIYFSGHRGYHVQVQESLSSIDQASRKEIVDYVMGTGIDPALHGLSCDRGLGLPTPPSSGWGPRIIRSIYEIAEVTPLKGMAKVEKSVYAGRRQRMLEELMQGNLETLSRMTERKKFDALLASAINRATVRIDPVVTTDIHRLFRLPETLNGKTGLSKRAVSAERLGSFDPLTEAVVLKGGVRDVHIWSSPRFRLLDEWYGPYRDEEAALPQEVAVLLVCKGVAEVSD